MVGGHGGSQYKNYACTTRLSEEILYRSRAGCRARRAARARRPVTPVKDARETLDPTVERSGPPLTRRFREGGCGRSVSRSVPRHAGQTPHSHHRHPRHALSSETALREDRGSRGVITGSRYGFVWPARGKRHRGIEAACEMYVREGRTGGTAHASMHTRKPPRCTH